MAADVIVIGLGSSGAPLAARLSEDPTIRVLALEAGPNLHDPTSIPEVVRQPIADTGTYMWGTDATFIGNRTGPLLLGKGTGGGSAVNGAYAMHAFPEDFALWEEISGREHWGWPSMLGAYRSLESDADVQNEYHGRTGPIPVTRCREDELVPMAKAFRNGWSEAGRPLTDDLNHPDTRGVGFAPQTRRGGDRVSAAIGYLQPAGDRSNLQVRTGCQVRRVLVRDGSACGVEIADANGTLERLDAGEVVLCAGAVWDPVLLLRSGIGAAESVRALGLDVVSDLPGVGQHLMDHPSVPLAFVPVPQKAPPGSFVPQVQLFGLWSSTLGRERNDLMFNLLNPGDFSGMFPGLPPDTLVSWIGTTLMQETSRGSVTLPAGPDARPSIFFNYLDESLDRTRLREGVRMMFDIFRHSEFADQVELSLTPPDSDFEDDAKLDAYMRSIVGSFLHPACTCRMAPLEQGGVVDGDLRVYGVDNLRIVSAAIMPRLTRANPYLTCIAIGEVAAKIMMRTAPATTAATSD